MSPPAAHPALCREQTLLPAASAQGMCTRHSPVSAPSSLTGTPFSTGLPGLRRSSSAGVPAEVPRGPSLTREPQGRPQRRQQHLDGRGMTATPDPQRGPRHRGRRHGRCSAPHAPRTAGTRMRRTAPSHRPARTRAGGGREGVGARMRSGVL